MGGGKSPPPEKKKDAWNRHCLKADGAGVDGGGERSDHAEGEQHGRLVANRQVDPRLHDARQLGVVLAVTALAQLHTATRTIHHPKT